MELNETTAIGQRIRHTRKQIGMTQTELANKVKISNRTISMYENGHSQPNFETAQKITNELGVPLSSLSQHKGLSEPKKEKIMLTRENLLEIEIECLKECAEAIEMDDRPFTESERLHYEALEAIQALRKYKEQSELTAEPLHR